MNLTTIEAKILELENLLYPKQLLWQNEILDLHFKNLIPSDWLKSDFLLNFQQLQQMEETGLLPKQHLWFSLSQKLLLTTKMAKLYDQNSANRDVSLEQAIAKKIKAKKSYEINQLIDFAKLHQLFSPQETIVDLAGGKGHLSHAMQVAFMDFQLCRKVMDKDINFYSAQLKNQFYCFDLLKTNTLPIKSHDHLFLLHGCGNLSDQCINIGHTYHNQSMCLVGCCYHLMSTRPKFSHYELSVSHEALHLATKTNRIFDDSSWQKRLNQKHYRYSFEIWFRKTYQKPMPALRSSPKTLYREDYLSYAKEQLQRLCIKPTNANLNALSKGHEDDFGLREKLILLGSLRKLFARPIEIYIALKRAMVILQKKQDEHLIMGEIFDRKISPRNILIATIKK